MHLKGKALKLGTAPAVSQNSYNLNQRYQPMNMSVSPDLTSATISAPQYGSRPSPPPERVSAIETMGGSLSDDVKGSVLTGAAELKASGASSEQVKTFVDSELAANGVDVSGGDQRSGQLVDMMS